MKKLPFVFSLLLLLTQAPIVHGAPAVTKEVAELLKPKLNSDRITYFFGSYGVEQIHIPNSPFEESRISNLYSVHGDEKIMRTLAVVEFAQPIPESLEKAHFDISQGKSIGIALRDHGWKIDKLPVYFGSIELTPSLKAWMHEKNANRAALHIYQLNVFKENSSERIPYCTIIEVHSPQYLDEPWLKALYQNQYETYRECSGKAEHLIRSTLALFDAMPRP